MLGASWMQNTCPGAGLRRTYDRPSLDKIAFSTLLMGLIVGVQPVGVKLSPGLQPAAVVFTLDGKPVARSIASPWQADVDFGPSLRPVEIRAEAIDASGARIAGVSRLVNLPASAARLDILLERSALGAPSAARLVATSVRKETPLRLALTLDGKPLAVSPDGRATLPALDLSQAHVLSGVAEFAKDAVARADIAIGGGIADESGSRLTALAVRVASDAEPTVESLRNRLRHDKQGLQVVAVEKPPATVLLVRDPNSARANGLLGRNTAGTGVRLDPEDRVGLVWPLSHEEQIGAQQTELLESTPYFTGKEGGLLWVLTRVSRPQRSTPPYRYADAIAVAAVEAYRSGSRRAVVLAASYGDDASQLNPEQVRGYLATLGVPLHVWSFGPKESAWGDPEPLTSFVGYQRAATALKKDLDKQRIIWLAGEWIPGTIELAPGNDNLTLVR